MESVFCCFRSKFVPLVEFGQGCSSSQGAQSQDFLDVLQDANKAADWKGGGYDWMQRCMLQLDVASRLLHASIRLYISREDGKYELLLVSTSGVQSAALPGPAVECRGDNPITLKPAAMPEGKGISARRNQTANQLDIDSSFFELKCNDAKRGSRVQYLSSGNANAKSIALVPLSSGADRIGLLMLTPEGHSKRRPAGANAPGNGHIRATEDEQGNNDSSSDFLRRREQQLGRLGIALSLALTPDLPSLRCLANSLGRLSAAASLRETLAELCDVVSYHVRQRFLLEPVVRAALVADADATTAFMLGLSGAPYGCHYSPSRHVGQPPTPHQAPQQLPMPLTPPSQSLQQQPFPPLLPTPQQERQQGLASIPDDAPPNALPTFLLRDLTTTPWDPTSQNTPPKSSTETGGDTHAASGPTSIAHGVATVPQPSSGRSPPPLPQGCSSEAEASVLGFEGFPPECSDTAAAAVRDLQPQLLHQHHQHHQHHQPLRLLSPGCVATACEAAGGSLVARPFQLSYSLLLRLQMQQPRMYGIAVQDCARFVQDVNQPSRDVCLLMGSSSSLPPVSQLASVPADSSGQPGSLYGCRSCTEPTAAAAAAAAGYGNGGAVKSLVLVGIDAGDGVTLGFYVCLPHRLPGQLVEAVKDSCQNLLNRPLPVVSSTAGAGGGGGGGGSGSYAGASLADSAPPGGAVLHKPTRAKPFASSPATRSLLAPLEPLDGSGGGGGRRGGSGEGAVSLGGGGIGSSPDMPFHNLSISSRSRSATIIRRCFRTVIGLTGGDVSCGGGGGGGGSGSYAGASLADSAPPGGAVLHKPTRAKPFASSPATRSLLAPLEPLDGSGGGGGRRGGSGEGAVSLGGGGIGSSPDMPFHNLSISSRSRPNVDASLCDGGSASAGDLLVQMTATETAAAAAAAGVHANTAADTDLFRDLLTSRQFASGPQPVVASDQQAEVIRRAASVIVICDVGTEPLSSCQQQLGALVTSVRDSITTAAANAANAAAAAMAAAAVGGGAFLSLPDTASRPLQSVAAHLRGGADGAGSTATPVIADGCNALVGVTRHTAPGYQGGWGHSHTTGITSAAATGAATATAAAIAAGFGLGAAPAGRTATTTTTITSPAALLPPSQPPHQQMSMYGIDSEDADVADLQLVAKLGQGGGGSVFLGQMAGGLEVTVKLLELPSGFNVEDFVDQLLAWPAAEPRQQARCGGMLRENFNLQRHATAAAATAAGFGGSVGTLPKGIRAGGAAPALGVSSSGNTNFGAVLAAEAVRQQVRAQRSLLQSATELAMLTSISHPNIVQVYGTYNNVVLVTCTTPDGGTPVYQLRHHWEVLQEEKLMGPSCESSTGTVYDNTRAEYSRVCSAVCMTFCDLGSLYTALTQGAFPNRMGAVAATEAMTHGSDQRVMAVTSAALPAMSSAAVTAVNPNISEDSGVHILAHMRSVYLTLLEVALALRYLHGRNILHRDLKPGNILLKSRNPTRGDPRGFTTKLADFGLALVMMEEEKDDKDSVHRHQQSVHRRQQHPQQHCYHRQQSMPAEGGGGGGGGGGGLGFVPTGSCLGPRGPLANTGRRYAVQDQACGTVDHMSPEALRGNGSRLTAASDVYSFGVVMLEVVTGARRPFGTLPSDRISRLVMAGTRPLFPAWVPAQYRSLAESCWSHNPHLRPSAAQLVVAIRDQLNNNYPPQPPQQPQQQPQPPPSTAANVAVAATKTSRALAKPGGGVSN
ncbi:hypothetical protein VOLCADRAFT_95261 [Volvox carteri f. nagariensis]|uniref:Protein kinase domain-containing protein n=1 Tax=Volvox carteri f. nagariensis TaxID=3068 RepID=D8U714_VOLCA|nr:uncharacterized protein VOLCADRAFT_95261 [Volvox carteri f. nagariensis]EFJ44536.1 hypothetical protein VOLCADRAFT_95261 [Volvox carteri f. nagariensis]|eukprot:XP_002954386.1 hypothetical protein VOLCADRAFT_95261 [Volvox carteri f. nagariensis]